jgi:hypothetical protein
LNRYNSEQTQKAFDLRQELFKKITEMHSIIHVGVGNKVGIEEFQEALS